MRSMALTLALSGPCGALLARSPASAAVGDGRNGAKGLEEAGPGRPRAKPGCGNRTERLRGRCR
jgi:hypothetical protein